MRTCCCSTMPVYLVILMLAVSATGAEQENVTTDIARSNSTNRKIEQLDLEDKIDDILADPTDVRITTPSEDLNIDDATEKLATDNNDFIEQMQRETVFKSVDDWVAKTRQNVSVDTSASLGTRTPVHGAHNMLNHGHHVPASSQIVQVKPVMTAFFMSPDTAADSFERQRRHRNEIKFASPDTMLSNVPDPFRYNVELPNYLNNTHDHQDLEFAASTNTFVAVQPETDSTWLKAEPVIRFNLPETHGFPKTDIGSFVPSNTALNKIKGSEKVRRIKGSRPVTRPHRIPYIEVTTYKPKFSAALLPVNSDVSLRQFPLISQNMTFEQNFPPYKTTTAFPFIQPAPFVEHPVSNQFSFPQETSTPHLLTVSTSTQVYQPKTMQPNNERFSNIVQNSFLMPASSILSVQGSSDISDQQRESGNTEKLLKSTEISETTTERHLRTEQTVKTEISSPTIAMLKTHTFRRPSFVNNSRSAEPQTDSSTIKSQKSIPKPIPFKHEGSNQKTEKVRQHVNVSSPIVRVSPDVSFNDDGLADIKFLLPAPIHQETSHFTNIASEYPLQSLSSELTSQTPSAHSSNYKRPLRSTVASQVQSFLNSIAHHTNTAIVTVNSEQLDVLKKSIPPSVSLKSFDSLPLHDQNVVLRQIQQQNGEVKSLTSLPTRILRKGSTLHTLPEIKQISQHGQLPQKPEIIALQSTELNFLSHSPQLPKETRIKTVKQKVNEIFTPEDGQTMRLLQLRPVQVIENVSTDTDLSRLNVMLEPSRLITGESNLPFNSNKGTERIRNSNFKVPPQVPSTVQQRNTSAVSQVRKRSETQTDKGTIDRKPEQRGNQFVSNAVLTSQFLAAGVPVKIIPRPANHLGKPIAFTGNRHNSSNSVRQGTRGKVFDDKIQTHRDERHIVNSAPIPRQVLAPEQRKVATKNINHHVRRQKLLEDLHKQFQQQREEEILAAQKREKLEKSKILNPDQEKTVKPIPPKPKTVNEPHVASKTRPSEPLVSKPMPAKALSIKTIPSGSLSSKAIQSKALTTDTVTFQVSPQQIITSKTVPTKINPPKTPSTHAVRTETKQMKQQTSSPPIAALINRPSGIALNSFPQQNLFPPQQTSISVIGHPPNNIVPTKHNVPSLRSVSRVIPQLPSVGSTQLKDIDVRYFPTNGYNIVPYLNGFPSFGYFNLHGNTEV